MKPPDEVRRDLAGQWIGRADDDLAAAEILLANGNAPDSIIAFHAQQAVEKYLKAVLVRRQMEFPKTHDIGRLLDLVGECEPDAAVALSDAASLTPYSVEFRYPGDAPEFLAGEVIRVVEIARQSRDRVKDLLKAYFSK